MATATFSTAPTNATDAAFRAWGKAISDALAAVGMVKTADTGQINWATVATPAPTNNVAAGYEVWRFDDTLQSTHPVFVKLEYGSSQGGTSTAGARVQMWITIGKGSDGAGNITGVMLAQTRVGTYLTSNTTSGISSTAFPGYVSLCASKACLAVFPFVGANTAGTGQPMPGFIIERSRDGQGAPTGDGLLFVCMAGQGTSQSANSPATFMAAINYASATANTGIPPVVLPYTFAGATVAGSSTLASGVIAPVMPWVAFAPGLAPWQPRAGLTYLEGDLIEGTTTVNLFGEDRTYRVIPVSPAHNGFGVIFNPAGGSSWSGVNRTGVAILWES